MKYKGLLTDRRHLIEALEQETGIEAIYCGAPSFKYTIGEYTVFRDGSLECNDEGLISKLTIKGLIESNNEKAAIHFPIEAFTGRSLTNLVNILSVREKFLNKALDHPNAFHMSVSLVRELKNINPVTISEFMEAVHKCGGKQTMRGLSISGSMVNFPAFPDTPAFHALANLIVKAAISHGWIRPATEINGSEKYRFRVWLNSLGMKGPEYKAIRAELLSHFEGNSSFRTDEQMLAYREKVRMTTSDADFVLL